MYKISCKRRGKGTSGFRHPVTTRTPRDTRWPVKDAGTARPRRRATPTASRSRSGKADEELARYSSSAARFQAMCCIYFKKTRFRTFLARFRLPYLNKIQSICVCLCLSPRWISPGARRAEIDRTLGCCVRRVIGCDGRACGHA